MKSSFKNDIIMMIKIIFYLIFNKFSYCFFLGKFIIVLEDCFKSIELITLRQSKQLIDAIQYLYHIRILHRDIRPENVMYEKAFDDIKLVDFGFATTFKVDENKKELQVEGVTSYADLKFLKIFKEAMSKRG